MGQVTELQTRAEGECSPTTVKGTTLKHGKVAERIPQIVGMEEGVANRPPWATPLRHPQ